MFPQNNFRANIKLSTFFIFFACLYTLHLIFCSSVARCLIFTKNHHPPVIFNHQHWILCNFRSSNFSPTLIPYLPAYLLISFESHVRCLNFSHDSSPGRVKNAKYRQFSFSSFKVTQFQTFEQFTLPIRTFIAAMKGN